ncbi:sodium:solute symporter [Catalinimonas niigatensis]|uniref:sodium:solute symporter n=1 Tax=Catalinimonas niigatensis TaxID=1397264 RepID=UPI002665B445|nr:sodium:solute symporter [Catalinimonas niigatensis]WPP53227.1 sodium:solute symporter [Catalinimonas niigatensis]
MKGLETLDWIVIGGYFLVILGIALWVILQKQKDTADYFLAGRNMGWFVVGASIFASNIGSEHVVGLAGTGASDKLPLLIYELHAWIVLMLGWVFLPFYARSGVFTMPEFLEKRYSPNARWFLSIFSLLAYILTKVSVTIYAGGVVISSLLQIDFLTGALATVVLTGIYTVLGGMKAVVYTEALQTVILIIGAATLTFMGLDAVGGWGELKATVGEDYFDMWRPPSDPDFPWPSLVITSTIVGIWYWCTDQYIVQRVLTARNIKEGRRGTIWGGFLKLLPVFLFLIPGVIALALKQQGKLEWESADQAFPVLMSNLLPAGLRGLVAAGLLAALMSSLASVFNSCATLFTKDIYEKLRPGTPEKKLLNIGKIATVIIVFLGIAWIPVMQNISGVLYEYLQSVQSYIAPPITAVFLLGVFSKRINAKGAMATLVIGLAIAVIRLTLELSKDYLDPESIFFLIGDMNFLSFAAWMFLASVLIAVVVSLMSPAPSEEKLSGLTYSTLSEEQKAENKASYNIWDILASLAVLAIVVFIMISFNG